MAVFRKSNSKSSDPHDIERERDRFLQGQIASRQIRDMTSIQRLADVEFGVFSQWGEDGILEWIIAQIDDVPESFVEFGVEDYRESNTRFLLQNRNWRGLVIDGSEKHVERIKSDGITWRHDLTACASFIDCSNINQLIRDAGFLGDIGVLSVDIDGNDYWVWEAIDVVNAAIVVVETNAIFGDLAAVSVPYRADFERAKAHFSNLFFGASPKALSHLAEKKNYQLLGSNLAGSNLFFVHNDYAAVSYTHLTLPTIYSV